jgi:superfamily II DNA or RNA helicase
MSKKCKSDKECERGKICSLSGSKRCVKVDGAVGKAELSSRIGPVVIPPYILPKDLNPNPVLQKTKRVPPQLLDNRCPDGTILNPETGRCVKIDGAIGKRLLRELGTPEPLQSKYVKHVFSDSVSSCITKSKVPLREVQIKTVEYFNNRDSVLVVHGTGMGKTLTALTAAQCYLSQKPKGKVVVLTAASLVDNFKNAYEQYGNIDKDKYRVINFDKFMNVYKSSEKEIDKCECKNTLFIIDEAHTLKNYKGQKFSAAMECAMYSDKVMLLTATPYVNSACDFISLINLLNRKYIIGPKMTRRITYEDPPIYKAKPKGELPLCSTGITSLSEENVKKQFNIIASYLEGKVSYAEKPVGGEYPEFKIHTVVIPMSKTFETLFMHSISSADVFTNPEKFYNGYRRAVNDVGPRNAYNDKLEYIKKNILKGGVSGNVIYSNWLEFGVNVISDFLNDNDISYAVISGETPIKSRKIFVDMYNKGEINTLVISSAGGTGLDLKGTQNIIVLDPVWTAAQLDQIIGRGVRYMSHSHLPKDKQTVNVHLLTLVEQAFIEGKKKVSQSGDYLLYKIIEKKRKFGKLADEMLKRISIL